MGMDRTPNNTKNRSVALKSYNNYKKEKYCHFCGLYLRGI